MSNLNAPTLPSKQITRLPIVVIWFSTWAGLGGLLGFHVSPNLGWREGMPPYIIASLVVGGGLAGWILHRPICSVVTGRRWILAAFLGTAVALMTLEFGVTFTMLAIQQDEIQLAAGLLFAPILASPVLLTAGPLSGMGLVLAGQIFGT